MPILSSDLDGDDVASRAESDSAVDVDYAIELDDVARFRMVRRWHYGRLRDMAANLCRVLESRGVEGTEVNADVLQDETAEGSVSRLLLAEDLGRVVEREQASYGQ